MINHRERSIMTNPPEATICDSCRLIPLSHLSLDVDEPVVVGWEAATRRAWGRHRPR